VQLTRAEITQQNKQKYLISGPVNFSTVPDLMQRTTDFFKSYKSSSTEKVAIDMSQVTDCNSAGLALMLEVVKHARAKKIELHFESLPDNLLIIAKAYGVESEIRELCE